MADEKEVTPPSWVKNMFFKLADSLVVKLLLQAGLKLTGPIGWIASFFIDSVLNKTWLGIQRVWIKVAVSRNVSKEVEKYEDKVSAPNASADEVKDAGKDFLSS